MEETACSTIFLLAQVLCKPELRQKYDAHGTEGLDANLVDGALFFTMLFGRCAAL